MMRGGLQAIADSWKTLLLFLGYMMDLSPGSDTLSVQHPTCPDLSFGIGLYRGVIPGNYVNYCNWFFRHC
jgi:hypothetical protein